VATDALTRVSPNALGRRLAARAVRRAAREIFGAEVGFPNGLAAARMTHSPALDAWPGGEACAYHASALAELLRILTGFEGIMRPVQCRGSGDAACEWQAVQGGDYE
jgi:hypothetical protein